MSRCVILRSHAEVINPSTPLKTNMLKTPEHVLYFLSPLSLISPVIYTNYNPFVTFVSAKKKDSIQRICIVNCILISLCENQ